MAIGPGNRYSGQQHTIDAQLTIGIVKNHANLKFGATNLTNQYYYSYIGGPNIGGYYYGSLTVYIN